MAVFRDTPRCMYCGKEIAKAIFHNHMGKNFVGDTFSHWEYENHRCKKMIEEGVKFSESPKGKELLNKILKMAEKLGFK